MTENIFGFFHNLSESRMHQGEKLKEFLFDNRVNRTWLIEKLGTNESAFYRMLKREKIPAIELQRLKEIIGFSLTESEGKEKKPTTKKDTSEQEGKQLPFFAMDATATPMAVFNDYGHETPEYFISIPAFNECDFALSIYGHSMYPKYKNGEIIAVKKIHDTSIILYGEVYLVVTKEYRTIKFIRKHKDPSKLTLASENVEFDPVDIKRDDIKHLFIVKGKIEISQI